MKQQFKGIENLIINRINPKTNLFHLWKPCAPFGALYTLLCIVYDMDKHIYIWSIFFIINAGEIIKIRYNFQNAIREF